MTVYYVTSLFRQLMLQYMKDGVDTYFDIVVINDDPQSAFGSQSVVLKNCNLDKWCWRGWSGGGFPRRGAEFYL